MTERNRTGKEKGLSAAEAEKVRLTSHWKMAIDADSGATIWTVSVPSILVCMVGSTAQDDGGWIPDTPTAASIVKEHNEALINPDAAAVRDAGRTFLESVRTAGEMGEIACKEHIARAARMYSERINRRR